MTDTEKYKILRTALEELVGASDPKELTAMKAMLLPLVDLGGDNAKFALKGIDALIATAEQLCIQEPTTK
jgi:hypothetical protein